MWYRLRRSMASKPDLASRVAELLEATLRKLVVVIGVGYVVVLVLASIYSLQALDFHLYVSPFVALAGILALRIVSRRPRAAQVLWQATLATAITLAVYALQRPSLGFFYVLLPLIGVVTAGWFGGLIAEAVVMVLVFWCAYSPWGPGLLSAYGLEIIVGSMFSLAIGWTAMDTLLTATYWSLNSYEDARRKVEEAREQRLELKQVQEDLIQANRELARLTDRLKVMHQTAEDARRAKEEFVANVSHELRTPLNMVIGFSDMITQSPRVYGAELPPALLADIAAIQRNSQHLAKLVNDVLDLSQVEAGRMALSKEWSHLHEVIHQAAGVVQALFDSKGLYLEIEAPDDLPAVFCDDMRIRQVVLNLLSNASRFTERGGVRVRAWAEEQEVVVSVADTGPGIAPDDRKRVFEPFEQLDGSIRRKHGGTGLGLSISRRFVEMHGGRMWLESEVGMGTTFHFSLPLVPPAAADQAEGDVRRWLSADYEYRGRTRQFKAPAPVLGPRFVLLETGDSLRRWFGHFMDDVEIAPVKDMEGAICELARSPVQALIINTPSLEEVAGATEGLSALPYGTPAVVCWVPGEAEAAKRLGVVRYLVKPVSGQALLSTLEDLGEEVRSVLLVDDEPELLRVFARILSSSPRSYRVLRATNGQRALSLLRQRKPDVMLLDLIMPGMDGFQVLQEKSHDSRIRDIPTVVVSSRDPINQPIVSDTLTVTRKGGLPVQALVQSIRAVSEILFPVSGPVGRGRPGKPSG